MMACDALLNGSGSALRETSECPRPTTREDDRAASRLLLLLRMLEAPEIALDMRGDGVADADRHRGAQSRPLLGRFHVKSELGSWNRKVASKMLRWLQKSACVRPFRRKSLTMAFQRRSLGWIRHSA